MSYNSKYTGEQVEAMLDKIANGEAGGGGGGITIETDPIFSASPAASITEAKKTEWDNKMDNVTLAEVATSGSYNDLSDKPTIPSAVTESTINGWGFTKNIGTITEVKMNGESKGTTGVVDLGTVITQHQDISGKQEAIADLDAIRSGAAKGATALQPTPRVMVTGNDIVLQPNVLSVVSEDVTDSLTIQLPTEDQGYALECLVRFRVAGEGVELVVPEGVQWADGVVPEMANGKTYEISFLGNYATFLEF